MEQDLAQMKCQPCRAGTPPFTAEEVAGYLPSLSTEWKVVRGKKLAKTFRLRNFLRAMLLVNAIAYLAEQEDHHPDISISYNVVTVGLTTHAIGGLSRNDFIMAAKIDRLVSSGV